MITDYTILRARNTDELAELVKLKLDLDDDWVLYGHPFTVNNRFYQGMVLRQEEDNGGGWNVCLTNND